VKKEYRGGGFGSEILNWNINKATEDGYQTLRLYTDINDNKKAVTLYEKMGFIGEKYDLENLGYDCAVYSKSLINKEIELWNNKMMNLSYQSELEDVDKEKIEEILIQYEKEYNI
jgi:RimJ/RimL family protein N-acetyltransferase